MEALQTTSRGDGDDFGGPGGHVAEPVDWEDVESIRVTRCATTQTAVTAYFCGADVATNLDVGRGSNRKMPHFGTESLQKYLQCRYEQGERNDGVHRRSVYRIGIYSSENPGYNHAFNIVAQPDGTFFWLQSFIGHYSLTTWMKKADAKKVSGLSGHLTYPELLEKLRKVGRLMSTYSWTDQANADYLDLFNADKTNESKLNPGRLDVFDWEEACEYPLPSRYGTSPDEESGNVDNHSPFESKGECDVQIGQLADLEEYLSSLSNDTLEELKEYMAISSDELEEFHDQLRDKLDSLSSQEH
ncbi:hypothetical protein ACHAWF_007599 [Thalassiosira exigua]